MCYQSKSWSCHLKVFSWQTSHIFNMCWPLFLFNLFITRQLYLVKSGEALEPIPADVKVSGKVNWKLNREWKNNIQAHTHTWHTHVWIVEQTDANSIHSSCRLTKPIQKWFIWKCLFFKEMLPVYIFYRISVWTVYIFYFHLMLVTRERSWDRLTGVYIS